MSHGTARMLDANTNRACEAARTLEDVARFVLDDAGIARSFKLLRQRVDATLRSAGHPRHARAADRDTTHDVGIANSARDAHSRAALDDLVSAAGARLTEALRVIEEVLKLDAPESAAAIERLRYDAYVAEAAILRAATRPAADWTLCVLVTESLCAHHPWTEVAEAAIRGGADCLQLREKSLPDRELLDRARHLVGLARPRGVAVVVNDRPDIALLAETDGVHLGQSDLSPSEARRIVGERLVLGVSCTDVEQARAAVGEGADIIGVGAMFDTSTKNDPRVVGPGVLRAILSDDVTSNVPHLAIGGIDASRVRTLAESGCKGIAVSSAVCADHDPEAATAAILAAFRMSTHEAEAVSGADA
ncbi:MAG: thiamine phosphate synthase [Planctomycetota bacterium]